MTACACPTEDWPARTEVAVIGGNHGGFDRIDALNDRMAAFIEAQAAGQPE
jgi:hypothetical protein